MKKILQDARERWQELPEWQRDMVTMFIVCTGCTAVGYWFGYRDRRDA